MKTETEKEDPTKRRGQCPYCLKMTFRLYDDVCTNCGTAECLFCGKATHVSVSCGCQLN